MTPAMIMKLLWWTYTIFWYNGYQVSDRDISSLNLYYDGIIPKVSIMFIIDSMGFMKKKMVFFDAKFEIFFKLRYKKFKINTSKV
jgi:hypothetical protein